MKIKRAFFVSVLCVVGGGVSIARSDAGNSVGGGGAQIESAFRLRAGELIQKITKQSQANSICSADLLEKTLSSTKVRVVPHLVDPYTKKAITGQKLDAWTVPGDIQLLENTSFSSENKNDQNTFVRCLR